MRGKWCLWCLWQRLVRHTSLVLDCHWHQESSFVDNQNGGASVKSFTDIQCIKEWIVIMTALQLGQWWQGLLDNPLGIKKQPIWYIWWCSMQLLFLQLRSNIWQTTWRFTKRCSSSCVFVKIWHQHCRILCSFMFHFRRLYLWPILLFTLKNSYAVCWIHFITTYSFYFFGISTLSHILMSLSFL